MGIDIRLPIGLMFSAFGILLTAYGTLSDKAIYQRSLGLNVNLGWGIVLLAFGAFMLVLGRLRSIALRHSDTRERVGHSERGIDSANNA